MQSGKVSWPQLSVALTVSTVSTMILVLGRNMAVKAGHDIVLAGFVTIFLALIAMWLIGTLLQWFPSYSLPELLAALLGKSLGRIISLGYALFFLLVVSVVINECTVGIHIMYLPDTPFEVMAFGFALLAAYSAYLGVESIVRFALFLAPLIFIVILLLMILSSGHINVYRAIPTLENGWFPVLDGSIAPLAYLLEASTLLMCLNQCVSSPRRRAPLMWTLVLASSLGVPSLVTKVLVLGHSLLAKYPFADLHVVRALTFASVSVRGGDALVMSIWVTAAITKAGFFLHCVLLILGEVFGLKNSKSLLGPFLIITSVWAVVGIANIYELNFLIDWILPPFALLTFEVGIPLLLLVIALTRRILKGI